MAPDIDDLKDLPKEEAKYAEHSEAYKEALAELPILMLKEILSGKIPDTDKEEPTQNPKNESGST